MAATAPARPDGPLTHRQIVTILVGLMMGMFLAALDQTIVATAIRTIADDLKGLDQQAWATTAYLITSTIVTPLYGKLSDIYGRKKFFSAAITIFIIGSVLCTLSQSMLQLAFYRAVQGLGAGGLFSLALAIIGDIVPPRERAKYQGYFLAVFGTSSVLGPVIGGFFAGQASILGIDGWRWVFLVNVPIGIAALFVVSRTLHLQPHPPRPPDRLVGRGHPDPRTRPAAARRRAGPRLGLGLGSLDRLLRRRRDRRDRVPARRAGHEGRGAAAPHPVPEPHGRGRLRRLRPHRHGDVRWPRVAAALPADRQGRVADQGRPAAAPADARHHVRLDPVGPDHQPHRPLPPVPDHRRRPCWPSPLFVFHYIKADTPLWQTSIVMVAFGLGLGFNFQPLTLAVQNAVSPRLIGVATSSATFTRQIGGTLGTAVFLSILFSTVPDKITAAMVKALRPRTSRRLHDPAVLADPANAAFAKGLQSAAAGRRPRPARQRAQGQLVPREARRRGSPSRSSPGFSDSMDLVFLVGAGRDGDRLPRDAAAPARRAPRRVGLLRARRVRQGRRGRCERSRRASRLTGTHPEVRYAAWATTRHTSPDGVLVARVHPELSLT